MSDDIRSIKRSKKAKRPKSPRPMGKNLSKTSAASVIVASKEAPTVPPFVFEGTFVCKKLHIRNLSYKACNIIVYWHNFAICYVLQNIETMGTFQTIELQHLKQEMSQLICTIRRPWTHKLSWPRLPSHPLQMHLQKHALTKKISIKLLHVSFLYLYIL